MDALLRFFLFKHSLKNQLLFAIQFLVGSLFFSALAINTVGYIPNSLRPLATGCGLALALSTVFGFYTFGRILYSFLPSRGWFISWMVVLSFQFFWAYFKAPLDFDGLVYHLTIILDSLQKNVWGTWSHSDWRIQVTPKIGEIPNLVFLALGGYRLVQFGHFASVILGSLSAAIIALDIGERSLARLPFSNFPPTNSTSETNSVRANQVRAIFIGLAYFCSPIVIKQMSSLYVDIAAWCYWTAALALLISLPHSLLWASCAIALHAGVKISGPLTALPLFVYGAWNLLRNPVGVGFFKIQIRSRIFGLMAFSLPLIFSIATWMLPNTVRWGNPMYPLNFGALIPASMGGNAEPFVPHEFEIARDFRGRFEKAPLPKPIIWFTQFFSYEVIANYDMSDGAWGFIGLVAAIFALVFFTRGILRIFSGAFIKSGGLSFFINSKKQRLKSIIQHPATPVVFLVIITFALMPARMVSRHGFLGGFLFVTFALWHLPSWNRIWKTFAIITAAVQFFYILGDRVILRGTNWRNPVGSAQAALQNTRDIIHYGEPQIGDHWIHRPYVRIFRRQEPQLIWVGKDSVKLRASYWGRKFRNRVEFDPYVCEWPFRCEAGKLRPLERKLASLAMVPSDY